MAKKTLPDEAEVVAAIKRLLAAGPDTDDDEADQWVDSQGVVDWYLEAAAERSLTMPTRQELGEACFWMAWLVHVFGVPAHQQLISELLTPSVGVAMFEIRPRVEALRQACSVALDKMLAKEEQQLRPLLPEDDIPF